MGMAEPLGTLKCVGASRSRIVPCACVSCDRSAPRQIDLCEMLAAREAVDPGRRPFLESRRERGIAEVRPRRRRGDGVVPHQHHPCLPLPQILASRAAPPIPSCASPASAAACMASGSGIADFRRIQHQRAQAAFAPRTNRLILSSQRMSAFSRISVAEMLLEIRKSNRRRREKFALRAPRRPFPPPR